MPTALLAGATGLVGSALLDRLVDSKRYERVHVVTRRPVGTSSDKIREHIVDFDRLEDFEGLDRVDDVFCTLGTTMKKAGSREAFRRVDFSYVLELGRLAKRLGAQQMLVVSSLGASRSARSHYLRVKGETEEALRELRLPALLILRPSVLLGTRPEKRMGESLASIALRALAPMLVGGARRWRAVEGRDVASAMMALAETNERRECTIIESDRIQALATREVP